MERFKVSGEELRNFYVENVSLGRVFKDIEEELRASNQVVCRFIVNGLDIKESDEPRFATVKLDEVQTLEYLTENSRDLVGLVLDGWLDSLPELLKKTEALSQRMRVQGISGFLKPVHDLVQNCEFLIDSIMMIRKNMGDQFLGSDIADLSKVEDLGKQAVREAIRAIENKDFIILADVLEYDLSNVLQLWHEHLQFLKKALHGECTGNDFHSEQAGSNIMGRKRAAN